MHADVQFNCRYGKSPSSTCSPHVPVCHVSRYKDGSAEMDVNPSDIHVSSSDYREVLSPVKQCMLRQKLIK